MIKAIAIIDIQDNCDNCPMAVEDEPVASYCPVIGDYVFLGRPTRAANCRLIPALGYLDERGNLVRWGDIRDPVTELLKEIRKAQGEEDDSDE